MKRYAVFLGVVVFVLGLILPVIYQGYIERTRTVPISNANLYNIDLKRNFIEVKDKLKIKTSLKMEDFNVDFETDGKIKELEYTIIEQKNKGLIFYRVSFSAGANKCKIEPLIVENSSQNARLIDADYFFEVVQTLNFKDMIPKENYPWYTIKMSGEIENNDVQRAQNYLMEGKDIRLLNENELPVLGYAFWVYGMEKDGVTTYGSVLPRYYIFK